MKYGDNYKHFKGGEYIFEGIALPLRTGNLSQETIKNMTYQGKVRYHENSHDIDLYSIDGAFFIDSELPHVVYVALKTNGIVWAREVDDFFGYKQKENGELVKKFSLMS